MYLFRKENQRSDESVAEFHTRLTIHVKKCDFVEQETEIRRQIIQGTTSSRLRRKAIKQGSTLEQLLKAARAMETADEQTSTIEHHDQVQVNSLQKKMRKPVYHARSTPAF